MKSKRGRSRLAAIARHDDIATLFDHDLYFIAATPFVNDHALAANAAAVFDAGFALAAGGETNGNVVAGLTTARVGYFECRLDRGIAPTANFTAATTLSVRNAGFGTTGCFFFALTGLRFRCFCSFFVTTVCGGCRNRQQADRAQHQRQQDPIGFHSRFTLLKGSGSTTVCCEAGIGLNEPDLFHYSLSVAQANHLVYPTRKVSQKRFNYACTPIDPACVLALFCPASAARRGDISARAIATLLQSF